MRLLGIPFLALMMGASSAARANEALQIIQTERRLVLALVLPPQSQKDVALRTTSISEVQNIFQKGLEGTAFQVRIVPDARADACRTQSEAPYVCLVNEACPDCETELRRLRWTPEVPAHVALYKTDTMAAPFMLVLRATSNDEGDTFSATLYDVNAALQVIIDPSRYAESEQDTPASMLTKRAIVEAGSLQGRLATSKAAAQRILESYVDGKLIRAMEDRGFARGTVDLTVHGAGFAVQVDGKGWITEGPPVVRLEGLVQGPHSVSVSHPDYATFNAEVEVRPDAPRAFDARMPRTAEPPSNYVVARNITLAGAGGAIIAGIAVGALAFANRPATPLCIGACEGGGLVWSRVGANSDGFGPKVPTEEGERPLPPVNGSGPPLPPIAVGLSTLGLALGAGVLAFGGDEDPPWWQIGAAAVLGAAAFGVMVAIEGNDFTKK